MADIISYLVLAALVLFSGVFLVRNQWVYKARTDILEASLPAYETLPSYETMMSRFWIWDASKFLGWHNNRLEVRDGRKYRGQVIILRYESREARGRP